MIRLLSRDWRNDLSDLFRSATSELVISSPYVTHEGVDFLASNVTPNVATNAQIDLLTDLSPINICLASTDPAAISELHRRFGSVAVRHLPRVHAKVYVADGRKAIVTSGNLTFGGLTRNYEYGVAIDDPGLARAIQEDIAEYSALGASIGLQQLEGFCRIAEEVRESYRNQQAAVAQAAAEEFRRRFQGAEDELIRLRLAGGAMHTVFERTILYLLRRDGPMATVEMHPLVSRIHPDLCDNSVDRIIDGKSFGKKWKHAVRTAQQNLKKHGIVEYREQEGRWALTPVGVRRDDRAGL